MLRRLPALLLVGFVFSNCAALAKEKWTELNIGPFYIDTQQDVPAARNDLAQLEQLRWALGGLLESQDLPSLWPIRVLLTRNEKAHVISFQLLNGQYLLVCSPETRLPIDQVTRLLLDANTQRLPAEVESGLPALLSTLEAHGAHVTWGAAPPHPDLNWARLQLFATKFDYSSDFHIFLAALKSGTDLRAAERNAFGKDPAALEQEVAAYLAKGSWQPITISGRPLDPRHDFGEHELDDASAQVYLASFIFRENPDVAESAEAAESAYKEAIAVGGQTVVLGYEGMAALAEIRHENPKSFYDQAIKAGSHNAFDFVGAADGLNAPQAIPLLKQAEALNPRWADPVFQQAQLTIDNKEKLDLLKQTTHLNPRATKYWVALAQFQTTLGQAGPAQSSWVRAEDSAATEEERDRIHQQRLDSEQERLDAEEKAAKAEREAARVDDERARNAEGARIHAAEERANQGKDNTPVDAVPWSAVVPQKHVTGRIVAVDCLGANARLKIQDRAGNQISLYLKDVASIGLACGPQKPARSAVIGYSAQPDDRFQTAGQVTSLKIQ